ncbi:MAG: hypothetical protein M3235_07535 [Actinomycetota bacterium]|nr:hypothetical protein [Actinomycetota bacterium]
MIDARYVEIVPCVREVQLETPPDGVASAAAWHMTADEFTSLVAGFLMA